MRTPFDAAEPTLAHKANGGQVRGHFLRAHEASSGQAVNCCLDTGANGAQGDCTSYIDPALVLHLGLPADWTDIRYIATAGTAKGARHTTLGTVRAHIKFDTFDPE
eukprot:SAG22_NODE_8428_length_657_cov_1.575269_2_plen_106_part_00